ncbi:MAG TPA: hypothetical protein DCL00_02360 [Opitutae bacterium]|nr:hypothetical protein [Opitutae bacterium]|tara:strand:+ start:135 stop:359 length:225 start_codon:yes stop_codon:yes gene_type:complete
MRVNFLTCANCDFEWHRKDGVKCPVCSQKKEADEDTKFKGGLFGSGENAKRMTLYYQAIGLVALVYLLYIIFWP